MDLMENTTLRKTPLHDLHLALGGKMVPFAGYDMPVQYPMGIMKEHLHTRAKAGLFDVSHMGQAVLKVPSGGSLEERHTAVAGLLERLTPGDFQNLKPGAMRYTLLLNERGGIMDDLMVTRPAAEEEQGALILVVNAATKDADFAHIENALGGEADLQIITDHALLALQGPKAVDVFAAICPDAKALTFMTSARVTVNGTPCFVTRSGYTGEDGYEISVPSDKAESLARQLLDHEDVEPIGLGARDSLRLEAGLCLYGHDIDANTTPVTASLKWAISKRRREEGGFPGDDIILAQLKDGVPRQRVGILPLGRAPAREGTIIEDTNCHQIGIVTSGGFGPSVGGPIAMGYIDTAYAEVGTDLVLIIRGKEQPAKVASLPFVQQNYYRG